MLFIVLLAFGAALHGQTFLLVAMLSLAAAAEWRLSQPETGAVPRLIVASALALLIDFWIALAGPGGGPMAIIFGVALLALGTALRATALATLGTAFVSVHRAGPLVTHGIYRRLRHPSETGQLLLGLGAAVVMASRSAALWWALAVLPLTLWRLRDEEVGLSLAPDYASYRDRVPALLPRVPFTLPSSSLRWRGRSGE